MRFLYTFLFITTFALAVGAQVPTPSISVSPTVLCSGRTATFTSASPSITVNSFIWSVSPGTGVVYQTSNSNSQVAVSFANAGRYVISLIWDFGTLGNSTKTISVNVTKSALSSFNASLNAVGFPNELVLTNYSSNFTKNYWVYNNDFSNKDSSANTFKVLSSPGEYKVTLITIGSLGCNDSSSYTFTLASGSSMSLPNVFSPNGDGINESFHPNSEGLSSIHIMIFNRLGNLIVEWDKVNGFWDGRTSSGLACDAGVYFVIAEATGFDGKTYSLKNTLTLVR